MRSGDVCAEPASQWGVGAVAVGASEGRVVVPSRAVEVVVMCPEDEAFAEFQAKSGQESEFRKLVQGNQFVVAGGQDLLDTDDPIESTAEPLGVSMGFAEAAPVHMQTVLPQELRSLEGILLDASGEARGSANEEDVTLGHGAVHDRVPPDVV